MNFTVEEFLDVFEKYNEALWPLQIVAYVVGIALVALALTKWKRASAVIFGALAVMWAGMAVGYMWLCFADINPAAKLFGALFLTQAVLLAIACGTVVYPLPGMALGHGYPRAPMFGLVPCPTTIFTFGMLLLAAGVVTAVIVLRGTRSVEEAATPEVSPEASQQASAEGAEGPASRVGLAPLRGFKDAGPAESPDFARHGPASVSCPGLGYAEVA